MSDASAISELLVNAIHAVTRHFVIVEGTVTDVDLDAWTCSVRIGEGDGVSTFYDVPLKVEIDPAGGAAVSARASFLEIPEEGTGCLFGFRDGNLQRPQLYAVDKTVKILINAPLVEFNGGQLGGMVKVIDLTEKLNNLENLVNNLIGLYNLHTHPVISEGAPTGPTGSTEGTVLTPTEQAEIENLKIKQ